MTPLQALKPNDFAKLFSPKLPPPIIPPVGGASPPTPSGGNNNTMLYLGFGILLVVVVVGSIYMIDQNKQIIKQITLLKESNERIMPSPLSTNSTNPKTQNHATQTEPTAEDPGSEKS